MPVRLEINAATVNCEIGRSLFEIAEQIGVQVPTSCFKNGKCRECLVEVVEGGDLLVPPTAEEQHLREGFRLSCRARIAAADGFIRCHTLRRGEMRIDRDTQHLQDVPELSHCPAVTRDGDRILLDGNELTKATGPLHGLAVDIGTTTVVARLVDLETGNVREIQSFENPQRFAGSDIMARIHYDSQQRGRLLQRTLLAYLGHAIEAMQCDPQTIYEVVLAGNTTMRDLAFGIDVHSIGQRPYRSLIEHELEAGHRSTTSLSTTAKKLRLPIFPEARVYSLPLVSGHVGADAAAAILAIGLMCEGRTVALMDIGTNTELIVGNREQVMAASCPAGPAFEGGAITCGMPALEGAIESIRLPENAAPELRVIGNKTPQGICGSGLIDAISELRRTKRINELGRFGDEAEQLVLDAEHSVVLHERDISELAQAKGANVAGLKIVLKNYGVELDQLDRFYLAGGFARHLDLCAARRIGLIPDLPDEKIVQIGNASIAGATRALCSVIERRQLEDFVQRIEHVELETDEDFFDHFVEGCQFHPVTS